MKDRTKGFTLIELLVVISIIALLIGILLPALGEAKRRAQMLLNTANLGEYGKGMKIYVTENRGRMPNIPSGTDENPNKYIAGKPALVWAIGQGRTEPDSPSGNAPGAHNGFAFAPRGLMYDDVWRFPNLAFGDYISDGEGFELLTDVHASPGSSTAANWDLIKEGFDPDIRPFEEKFRNMTSSDAGWFLEGFYSTKDLSDENHTLFALQGDYRYTMTALYGEPATKILTPGGGKNFWQPQSLTGGPQQDMPFGTRTALTWRSYIQESAFDFPSDKVIFWDHFATLSQRGQFPGYFGFKLYFMPEAEVPVTTGDGSARVIKPFNIMPNQEESSQAFETGVGWGTQLNYPTEAVHSTTIAQQFLGLNGPTTKPFAWFIATDFGPRGRDLAGGAGGN